MSSLFAALTTAVSGLDAQSSSIGNISNNLANSETVGFKSVGTSFEELVNASNATSNNPGGVLAAPDYENDVQGSITSTGTETNLGISGQGYFAVDTATTNASGVTTFNNQTLYTRQGDFTLDQNGYLVNSSGYYLLGYSVNSSGVVDTSATSPIQVSALLDNPVPTSSSSYVANLPSNASTGFTSSTSTVQIYDALGNPYDENYTWTKTGANTWNVVVGVTNSAGTSVYSGTIPMVFNTSSASTTAGTIGTIEADTDSAAGAAGTYTVDGGFGGTAGTAGDEAGVTIQFSTGVGTQSLDMNFGTYNGSTGLTQFANTNDTVTVTDFTQNGLPQGSFNNISINEAGLVSLNYSNGTNRTIAQIPIVQFYAQDQLQNVTGNAYEATLNSGAPRYSTAGTTGAGTISSSSLEQSNVDIASQFTTLIEAQQVYSANAKVVTADDGLLQTTINMVQ